MDQKLSPDKYASSVLALPDMWIEDIMQNVAEIPWLIEKTRSSPRIIELGYGGGLVANALKSAGRYVIVVEGSKELCERADAKGIPAIHCMFENFRAIPNGDCVVASFVLEHVAEPLALLKRIGEWASRLIVVVANAESWHRRIAVQMGLQPELTTLSARDHAVGHYKVYTPAAIEAELQESGWRIVERKGIGFKPLHNAALMNLDWKIVHAMAAMEVPYADAANLGIVCERV